MLDLTTLKFSVDTSELDSAMSKINDLAGSVDKLNKANVSRAKVEKDLSTEIDKSAKAQENLAKSTKDLADKLDPAEKLLQKLNNQYSDLVSGFTKGEAAILQQARAVGVAEDALAPFKSMLEKIKELTKDPFDASIGALRSVTKEFDAITQRATLAAQGISLTTKQLGEYSRIAAEVKGQVSKMGLDPTQGKGLETYNMLLKETQADYLQVALAVNRAKDAEELRNKTLRDAEKLMAQVAAAEATMMDEAVAQFRRNEERKIKAAEDAAERIRRANESVADSIQRINYMTEQVNKGMSASEASKRFDLAQQGVSPEQINALIAAENKLATARKANANVLAETTTNTNDAAKATQWLERELARAENAVAEFNKNLGTSSANKMFRFSEQLQKAGLNPEEAKALMDRYGAAIAAGQTKMHRDMEARLRDLSRAVSVQMGDVAVSLASGMNPFTVMIQQGDQLRGAFQMVNASAEDVNRSMQMAAGMIAKSFIDTGKAISSFFTGAIVSAGTATVDFAKSVVTTVFPALDGWRNRMLSVHGLASEMPTIVKTFDSGVAAASVGAGVAIAALVAGVTALGIAFVKTSNQQDELNKNLILTGASMGYTSDGALTLAKSMSVVGVSTSKSIDIISAFAKEGVGNMSQMRDIIPTVANSMKYLGFTADEMAKEYAKIAKDPVKALADLGTSTGLVSAETLQMVISLEQAGDKTAAVAKAVEEANKVYGKAADEMRDKYSTLGKIFIDVKASFSNLWSTITESTYSDTSAEKALKQYKELSSEMESNYRKFQKFLGKIGFKGAAEDTAALEAKVAGSKELITLIRQQEEAQAKSRESAARDNAIIKERGELEDKLKDSMDKSNKKLMTRSEFIDTYIEKLKKGAKYQEVWDQKTIDLAKEAANAEYDRMHRAEENKKIVVDGVGAFEEVYKRQIKQQEWLNSLIDKSSGYTSTYSEDVERLNKMLHEGVDGITITADEYKRYLRSLEEIQPYMKKQIAAEAELIKMNTQMNAVLDERIQAVQIEYEMMDKTASEKERLIKLLKIETDYKKQLSAIDEKVAKGDLADPILIALQKKAAEDTRNKGINVVNEEASLKSVQRVFDYLKGLSDQFADAVATSLFEGGKAGGKKMLDIIKNELRKPVTMAISVTIQESMGELLQQLGFGNGSLGGKGGGAESIAGALKDFFSGKGSITEKLTGGLDDITSKLSGAGFDSLGGIAKSLSGFLKGGGGQTIGQGLGYFGSLKSASEGKWGAALGGAAGTFFGGPIGAAIGGSIGSMVDSLFSGNGKDFLGADYMAGTNQKGFRPAERQVGDRQWGWSVTGARSSAVESTLKTLTDTGIKTIGDIERAFGLKLSDMQIGTYFSSNGENGSQGNIKVVQNGNVLAQTSKGSYSKDAATGMKEYAADLANVIKGVLSNIDLPSWAKSMVNELGTVTDADELNKVVQEILAAKDALVNLGSAIPEFNNLSDEAIKKLLSAAGGAQQLAAIGSSFYENFFSEQEKANVKTKQLTESLKNLGVTMPADRAEYRAKVEKALAEGNVELAAGLMKLSDAFAELNPAAEAAVSSIADMKKQTEQLQIELLRAQGKTAEADAAFRTLSTRGMTEAEKAVWDYNAALQKQIDDTNKQTELTARILELQGNTAALRELELQKLSPANQELQKMIWNLEDTAAATAKANAEAEKYASNLSNVMSGLNDTKFNLENQLLALQGKTGEVDARVRDKDLENLTKGLNDADKAAVTALYDYNVSLKKQVEEQQAAAEAAQRAAEEQARAAEQLKSAWQSITDAIYAEVNRIRGLTQGDSSLGFAALMNQFTSTSEAARGGNQDAAKLLPQLSQQLLDLGAKQATSLVELRRLQMLTANSLEQTGNTLTGRYGLTVPAFADGGQYGGGLALVGENGPELINFNSSGRVYTADQTSGMLDSSDVVTAIDRLNSNIDGLRIEMRADVTQNSKVVKLLDRLAPDGQNLNVKFLTTQNVHVV